MPAPIRPAPTTKSFPATPASFTSDRQDAGQSSSVPQNPNMALRARAATPGAAAPRRADPPAPVVVDLRVPAVVSTGSLGGGPRRGGLRVRVRLAWHRGGLPGRGRARRLPGAIRV